MELRLDATPEELPIFVAETDEMLQMLDEQLVRLEQDGPSPELLQEVFRAAHTIKGSSAAIGHLRMAKLTHAMETLLDKVRHGQIPTTPALTEQLFQGLDMLKALAAEVQTLQMTDLDIDGLVGPARSAGGREAGPRARTRPSAPSVLDAAGRGHPPPARQDRGGGVGGRPGVPDPAGPRRDRQGAAQPARRGRRSSQQQVNERIEVVPPVRAEHRRHPRRAAEACRRSGSCR